MEVRKLSLSIKDMEKTRRVLNGTIADLDDDTNHLLHQLGLDIVAEAKSNLHNNTNISMGTLLSSIRILNETKNNIEVGTDIDYAGYIEYGRGPVRPINAKFLHWIDKASGKDVFAKFAKATEPSPFLEPAVISKTHKFVDIFAQNMTQKARSLSS